MYKRSSTTPTTVTDVTGHRGVMEWLIWPLVGVAGGVVSFFVLGILQVVASVYTFGRSLLGDQLIDNIQSKRVAISGCDSGFGRMLAFRLARSGMTVFAGCLNGDCLESLKQEYPESNLFAYQLNVKNEESVNAFSAKVKAELRDKGLWAVVNNAGVLGPMSDDAHLSPDDYAENMDVNFFGQVRFTHALRSLLPQKSEGRIVFMLSSMSYHQHPYCGPYASSKTALLGYARTLRAELGLSKTWIITLSPGYYDTGLFAKQFERTSERLESLVHENNRITTPERDAIKKRQQFLATHNMLFVGPNKPSQVVDAQIHAIVARYPKNDYWLGWDWLTSKVESHLSETALVWLIGAYRYCGGDAL